jgi:hypothetical protein
VRFKEERGSFCFWQSEVTKRAKTREATKRAKTREVTKRAKTREATKRAFFSFLGHSEARLVAQVNLVMMPVTVTMIRAATVWLKNFKLKVDYFN